MWEQVCSAARCTRVARNASVDVNEKRHSHVELLYVSLENSTLRRSRGWVEVRENGIVYGLDVEKVMFSSGNVTEKARMAKIGM